MPAKKKKRHFKKDILYFCSSCSAVILLFVSAINLQNYLNKDKVLGAAVAEAQEMELTNQRNFWVNIVTQNPTYRDGWLELSRVEDKLGERQKAFEAYQKAWSIDPNSEKVLGLKAKLGF